MQEIEKKMKKFLKDAELLVKDNVKATKEIIDDFGIDIEIDEQAN